VFLFANKSPPIKTITIFLSTHNHKSGLRRMQTDQEGELAKSTAFCCYVLDAGYTLKITGAGKSFQNAISKQLHRTLSDMMHTILSGANLDFS